MRGGIICLPGTGGVLVVAPPSADFPLNLILYMPFSILTYSSNILKANFDRMDSMLACGTFKKPKFLVESCSLSERAPAMKLTSFTAHSWRPSVLANADFNDAYCPSAVSLRFRYMALSPGLSLLADP